MTRYGLKPEQMNDYKGLKGDPSDNIPGVSGIGEKTAATLIQKFGTLEALYEYIEKAAKEDDKDKKELTPKMIEKLLGSKEKAFFSKQLSTIVCDLDLDFSFEKAEWRKNLDIKKLEELFKDYGFFSLTKRLGEIGVNGQPSLNLSDEPAPAKIEFDTDKNNLYIADPANADLEKIASNPGALLVGHDLKIVFRTATDRNLKIPNKVFDTKIAGYLINPELRDYDLEKLYYAEFKETISRDNTMAPAYLWKLRKRLYEKMAAANMLGVFEDIEMPLIKVLAGMEANGIKIDTETLAKLQKSTNQELAKLEKKIYELAGTNFNINSPQQLGEIIFNKLGIKGKIRRTGGGALSTAAAELEKLLDEHPIVNLILQYRELQKLKTTYIEPFPLLIDPKDNRLHTTYNQTGTATGRLASQEPNLQNIPVRTELGQEFRKSFVPEKGFQLASFDYSQIELRIIAHMAHDEKMVEAFKRNEDIHTRTAAEIFEVAIDKVTKEMRRQAKVLNFGLIYGMGTMGFARAAGVDRLRAREFITKYLADFYGVARYIDATKEKAHKEGFVETLFGRRRYLPDIFSTIPQMQAQAERMAINQPIQGTGADLLKMAMIKIYDYMNENLPHDKARMLLQVHDELVFEIREDLINEIAPKFKELMESVYTLSVPLTVDVKCGQNWQEVEPLENGDELNAID
jgi:DNA polymerase-1